MKCRLFFAVSAFLMLPLCSVGQDLQVPHYGEGEGKVLAKYLTNRTETGEVLPWFLIEDIIVVARRTFKTEEDRQRYLRLERNVLRVLPYAIYAQKRYEQLDRELALVSSKKEEKRLVEACENEIKSKFNAEIKNLSVSQGKILIKLIQRQTGNTSYELVKEMKGSISAFFYQSVAKVFGHNLKSAYDPKEDFEIENIIRGYERLRPIKNLYNN
ncbi:DUF4294 domain-containing protein [Sphingobacterium psychroaquaticum]|uniref:DUF4294 domain-containing protein n=1 Tax=Sphingobacterium psychroaquaticum TaxID=561061 RepID=UPI001069B378|nr:DUF4294 domain-containing protein [Sphingobacterium psychroaquaticum]QBQ41474.1 DUF4294 domain-containing protein [Sphingobacterium psychroaquaticum]